MSILQSEKKHIEKEELDVTVNKVDEVVSGWQDPTVRGILKSITWPKFLPAVKYAVYCLAASVVIAAILYIYTYGIHELLGRLF